MKKLWIGLGIGFGVLVLAGVIALVAGGLWLKGKVQGVAEESRAFGEALEKTEARATALNERFTFAAPPKGVPVAVAESRLHEYLAVRAALQPVYRTYEAKAKALKESAGEHPGPGDAFRAMGTLSGFLAELRTTWLDALEKERMSPREYHAITAALYTSHWGTAMGELRREQRPALEEMKKSLEVQLASASGEAKGMIETQLATVKEQLAALPAAAAPTPAEAIHRANRDLYTKYQKEIEEQAAHGLDVLLAGDEGNSLGEAIEGIQGGEAEQDE
jgi:hypothetical protein